MSIEAVDKLNLPSFALFKWASPLQKKTTAVAAASLLFFGFQCAFPPVLTCTITALLSSSTYLAEKSLRREVPEKDWFNLEFDKKSIGLIAGLFLLRPFIIFLFCRALGVPIPSLPQEGIAEAIFSHPWIMIPLATVVAPIAEEILFRGVFLERLEDGMRLIDRHTIIKLGESTQQTCANAIQAVVFGVLHLRRKISEGWAIPVALMISSAGYFFARIKQEHESMIAPIAVHASNNLSAVIQIFLSRPQNPSLKLSC